MKKSAAVVVTRKQHSNCKVVTSYKISSRFLNGHDCFGSRDFLSRGLNRVLMFKDG
jgi:hypothetical protein